MTALANILGIAHYERLMLMRTMRFRILGSIGVAIPVLIGIFLALLEAKGVEFSSALGLGAFIPFYVYSFVQTIVIAFIVGDFRAADERAEIYEVVAGRPISTAELVLGKFCGVLGALLILSLTVLLLTVAIQATKISFLGSPFTLKPYLNYLFLMTLPAMFYMAALTFFLGAQLRQQTAVALVTVSYALAVLFFLGKQYNGIFDFGAFFAPLFYSDLIGLGDIDRLIDQRLFYMALGLFLLGLSIERYPRLAQSAAWTWSGRGMTLVGLGAAAALFFHMEQQDQDAKTFYTTLINEQQRYAVMPAPAVTHYNFDLELLQQDIALQGQVQMEITNPHTAALDTLLFTLNPGLIVHAVKDTDGNPLTWQRQHAVLRIASTPPLAAKAKTGITLTYSGHIDTDGFDLRRREKRIHKNRGPIVKGDMTAWIDPQSVFLPPRSRWYPVPGVDYGHAHAKPPNFASAQIKISVPADLTVITQGQPDTLETSQPIANGRMQSTWQVKQPIPVFSLNAGIYEVFTTRIFDIDFALYVHPSHQRQVLFFEDAREEVIEGIEQVLDSVEQAMGVTYPYTRLSIVEVPFQVQWYYEGWEEHGGLTQPGILMLEEDVFMEKRFKRDFDRFAKRGQRFFDPVQMKPMLLVKAISDVFFAAESDRGGLFRSPIVQLWAYDKTFQGENASLLRRGLPLYMQGDIGGQTMSAMFSRGGGGGRRGGRMRGRFGAQSQTNAPAWDTLVVQMQQQSLAELDPNDNPELYRAVLDTKGRSLFSVIKTVLGDNKFLDVMEAFADNDAYSAVSFADFEKAAIGDKQETPGQVNLSRLVHDWIYGTHVPGFTLTRARARKVDDGWGVVYQVIVRIRNGEPGRGFVRISASGREDEAAKNVEIEGGQEVEVSLVLWDRPSRVLVEPFFAKNQRPLMSPLRIADQVVEGSAKSYVHIVPEDEHMIAEIIVDNDDDGFSMPIRRTQRFLRPGLKGGNWAVRQMPLAYGRYEKNYRWKKGSDGAQPAIWTTQLAQAGEYDVAYYFTAAGFGRLHGMAKIFNIVVTHGEQADTLTLKQNELKNGWNVLGRFYFATNEQAQVELSDLANGRLYADAVRWRYIDPNNPEDAYEEEISTWQRRGRRGRRGLGRNESLGDMFQRFIR